MERSGLRVAEFVFPGHPDKLCDAIADTLVEEAIRREPRALVGVEVAVHRAKVFVTGRIAGRGAADIDVAGIARDLYRSAGYGARWRPAPEELEVLTELCTGPLEEGEAEFREYADDQAICVGYAVDNPATNWLPLEHWLAHRLARRLHRLREEVPELELGPDGKVIVGVRFEDGAHRLGWFSCSLQQREAADAVGLHRAVRVAVTEELRAIVVPGFVSDPPAEISVNGAGAFEIGGPEGDNGLAGKKLVMDAYGPGVPIGGGAWSGKDFFKADRAGGIYARRLAKLLVMQGHTAEATVTVGWRPGARDAEILRVEGASLEQAIRCAGLLDASLLASGETWSALRGLAEVARWGHFTDPELPWERFGRI